ncbi:MAG: glycosyltransferase family 2 protein [Hyphomonas sp.]|uniref:glycosyltransferase family 2 protein n=1 Tax=Hyphomonas sp. TaxID=87 RepID=UPI0017CE758B|nr:glycosyltransferase family A protein [Hyphomonas sp.]MBA3070096.1 glycosyltransferase family 2 protein [Hyphomonas sp.]MBU3921511.1 glycosyltransferase family 2 protein [Alphaproteobacteria bacterium]MBU4060328.1 glycosyltransferase family 2 protein [Alphaproteobacteria bacterium]MBU4162996.1 glycosyltransferase family 2 protein [Alphaproteobacteria bacterium]
MFHRDTSPAPRLAICIPAYRDDASALIRALSVLPEAAECALLLYDDGSGDAELVRKHEAALADYPGRKILQVAPENLGRSFARNWLVAHAPTSWILFIDADMLPDHPDFLARYLRAAEDAPGPALIAGGFSLDQVMPGPHNRLHHAQAQASDCVDAQTRRSDPGRFVFSSNILVHRDVLKQVGFDEEFSGWGWEDVDWGLRVVAAFPVVHIDNTATHFGLEPDDRLLDKFGASGPNFARLVSRHPEAAERMPLLAASRRVKGIPLLVPVARAIAAARFLPVRLRVAALKVYRAAAYAPYIEPVLRERRE